MKKYLLVVLAALGFAACTEDNGGTNFPQNGELEESYIAINLMSTDLDTRANEPDNKYEDGTEAERIIKTAYFFFFDENGEPFSVNAPTNGGATAPGSVNGKNHLSLTIEESTGKVDPNISDIKKAVLVLNTYKGVYPSKIVAVLNWTPADQPYSLEDLHEVLGNSLVSSTNGFVMSNSVYMDRTGKIVDAVPITSANIKTTAAAATEAPIDIYVERTAAKVIVTAIGKNTFADGILFDTEKEPSLLMPSSVTPPVRVYVNIKGWELYNDYTTTNLLKNIENWNEDALGLVWNNIPFHRSYWATSQSDDPEDSFNWSYNEESKAAKGFKTNYGFKVATAQGYADESTYTYCAENTNSLSNTEDYRTKVILKGQLMQEDGNGGYKALELARWYGNEYAGNEALRTAVAKSLAYTLFYKYVESGVERYISVDPNDIECVKGTDTGDKAYEVGFHLSAQGEEKDWFLYNSESGYTSLADPANDDAMVAATNAYLADNVEPALLYASGMTYYIVDIKHLGASGGSAEYGVVRNHVYQIAINSIKGYGSPIYSGLDFIVDNPQYPVEDEASYVAARINVLSWKVVTQGVDIVK